MSRKILGLDIRHDSVTAVLVETSIKGTWIEEAMIQPIHQPTEIVKDLTFALENITQKMNISGSICSVSLPPDFISFRNIQVPFNEKKKIAQILPFELEPTLPMPVEDLIIDFHTIKLSIKTSRTDLFTASIQKSLLRHYTDTLSVFNIHPKLITIGGYSPTICMMRFVQTKDQWLCVDMDGGHATVIGVASGQIGMVRTFPFTFDESGTPIDSSISMGLQQTLAGFEEMLHVDFQPETVYLTGSGFLNSNFDHEIERSLECTVQRIDLVHEKNIGFKNDPPDSWQPAQMNNALALALIEIEGLHSLNFRKGPFAEKNLWAEHKKRITRTGIFFILALISAITYFLFDFIHMQQTIHQIDQQIDDAFTATFPEVKNIKGSFLQYQQLQAELNALKQRNLISKESGANIRAIDILNQISKNIPNEIDVQFDRLVIGDDDVQITGDTDTLISVDNMKNRLEKASLFKNITITSANRDQSSSRVRFKLKVQL